MSSLRRAALASTLTILGALPTIGCGSSEREPAGTIQGQAPADYREQMEQNIAQPVSGSSPEPR
ncbi:2-C-methyl-D-erythritol 2,4-cyclodiphosphate synthase [Tautonia plasticadhaerens]|uniref:Uncharacterized protein n=1 Tax=Tautonia plasticadhaerens TaxID=2527974 RepID=A0A518H045_9BACT|nr:2-C-methyl-D-erythritol 2,4-cyclodiphosphate synthase [Tautonia plasticadhaerens]QDV34214.1 hypothetical protein ElP_20990 [Tautonia plasticadhaerens]